MLDDLTVEQQRLYERLLDRPSLHVRELADVSDGRRQERDLAALEAAGYVVRPPGRDGRVEARHPAEALALALARRREQAREAEALVQELVQRYAAARRTPMPLDLIEVVTGTEEILRVYHELEGTAQGQLRGCDRPPYVGDPDSGDETMFERLAAGVHYRVLGDPRSRTCRSLSQTQAWATAGVEFREMTRVPLKLIIVDDVRAMLVLDSREGQLLSSLVVHPSALLQGLCDVFESLWALAVPRDPAAAPQGAQESRALAPSDVELLSLLAGGMTDEAAARRLQVSSRTVQRRVAVICRRLGATNRFQAGLWAGRRGWL